MYLQVNTFFTVYWVNDVIQELWLLCDFNKNVFTRVNTFITVSRKVWNSDGGLFPFPLGHNHKSYYK